MKLNHLNLTVSDVPEAKRFLMEYFGLRPMDGAPSTAGFDILLDDEGLVLTLMRVGGTTEVSWPASFHIGFIQPSEERVNEINRRMKDDGHDVRPPRRFHGSWTFYFRAPGGFTVEVLC
jgi:catechol 2,3-dioxygenase-like lactoylglutathione lyase family enzyme